jgi:hypothetical protein
MLSAPSSPSSTGIAVKREESAGGMGLFVEEHGKRDVIARAYVHACAGEPNGNTYTHVPHNPTMIFNHDLCLSVAFPAVWKMCVTGEKATTACTLRRKVN